MKQIRAQETRTTARLQSSAQVTINIVNENDNLPSFALSSYTFEIAENSAGQALTSTSPAGLTMIQVSLVSYNYWLYLGLLESDFDLLPYV